MTDVSSLMESIRSNSRNTYFIGIDKETGGLNDADNSDDKNIPVGSNCSRHYAILQIAVIVYNGLFERLSKEPLDIIIYHSAEDLDNRVGDWSKEQFKNTLMIQCPDSNITLEQAEKMVIQHMTELGINKGDEVYMLGNSIRLDFEFMSAQMKNLKDMFKYRLLDVSTFKTLFTALYGRKIANFEKGGTHDALRDIEESVAELEFYLKHFIKPLDEVVDDFSKIETKKENDKKRTSLNERIENHKQMLKMLNRDNSNDDNGSMVFSHVLTLIEWIESNEDQYNLTEDYICNDILNCDRTISLIVMQFLSCENRGIFGIHYYCKQNKNEEMISSNEFEKSISNPRYIPSKMEDGIKIENYNYSDLGYHAYIRV